MTAVSASSASATAVVIPGQLPLITPPPPNPTSRLSNVQSCSASTPIGSAKTTDDRHEQCIGYIERYLRSQSDAQDRDPDESILSMPNLPPVYCSFTPSNHVHIGIQNGDAEEFPPYTNEQTNDQYDSEAPDRTTAQFLTALGLAGGLIGTSYAMDPEGREKSKQEGTSSTCASYLDQTIQYLYDTGSMIAKAAQGAYYATVNTGARLLRQGWQYAFDSSAIFRSWGSSYASSLLKTSMKGYVKKGWKKRRGAVIAGSLAGLGAVSAGVALWKSRDSG